MSVAAPDPAPTPRQRARDARRARVLETAGRLFYERGVHEVGMEELVEATGLSKPAVYRLFPSKDILIGSYLDGLGERILALIDEDARRLAPSVALHSVLTAVQEDLTRPTFRGCPFNNASVEFPDPEHPARAAARAYRRGLLARLTELSAALTGREAGSGTDLANQLAVIIDGAYVSSVHLGPDGPARTALVLGHHMIDQAAL